MTVYTNIGFIGIPVTKALLPEKAMLYVVICNVIYALLFYTHGITILSEGREKLNLKKIISPGTIMAIISLIIMEAALCIPYSIGSEVFMGFVGVGLPVDAITLGNIVNQGRQSFTLHPYQMLLPTAILCLITVAFYVIGNKFADASDPRNHV